MNTNDHKPWIVWEPFLWLYSILNIPYQLRIIMSKISEFAAQLAAFQTRIDTAVTDLQGDVKNLSDQIKALQDSAGEISAEDQALLDGITAQAATVADKLDALNALTPPVAPTA